MNRIIILFSVLFVSACATTPTMKSVAGTYERKKDGVTERAVLLENGVGQGYKNGKKDGEGKWIISKEGEIHIIAEDDKIYICRINPDGSLTNFATKYNDGKRIDHPKEEQFTLKRIK